MDGVVDIWDYFYRQNEVAYSHKVSHDRVIIYWYQSSAISCRSSIFNDQFPIVEYQRFSITAVQVGDARLSYLLVQGNCQVGGKLVAVGNANDQLSITGHHQSPSYQFLVSITGTITRHPLSTSYRYTIIKYQLSMIHLQVLNVLINQLPINYLQLSFFTMFNYQLS